MQSVLSDSEYFLTNWSFDPSFTQIVLSDCNSLPSIYTSWMQFENCNPMERLVQFVMTTYCFLFFKSPCTPVLWYSYISDPFSRKKSSHALLYGWNLQRGSICYKTGLFPHQRNSISELGLVFFRGESLCCFSRGKGSIESGGVGWGGVVSTLQYQHLVHIR